MPIRSSLIQAAILLVLLAALFPGFFFHGRLIVPGDVLLPSPPWDRYAPPGFEHPQNRVMVDVVAAFMPYYTTTKSAILGGEWPLWNPLEYMGVPLLANMQNASFYPPRFLHLIFDVFTGQSLYVLLKLWLCGMTAFWCAKGIGLKEWPSRFFSVAWMLSSYNILWAYWSLTDIAAWLPVLFLGVELSLSGRYRRGFFTTALGATLMLLAGHPETALTMGIGTGVYFVFRLAYERRWGRPLWAPMAAAGGAWVLALLICASMILPFVEYLSQSWTFAFREAGSIPLPFTPGNLVSFWVPRFFGTAAERNYWHSSGFTSQSDSMIYPGMAVWVGISMLLLKGDVRRAHKERIVCLIGAGMVCLLMAFNAPLLDRIGSLPVLNSTYRFYHAAFTLFALPLLAAIGVENGASRPRKLRESACFLVPAVPAVVLLWYNYRFNHGLLLLKKMIDYMEVQFALAVVFAVLTLSAWALYLIWKKPGVFVALLTIVLAADQLVATRGLLPTLDRKYVYPDTQLTQFLQKLEKPVRIGTGEGNVASGLMPVYGIEELLGYDGLYPARVIRLFSKCNETQWKAVAPAMAVEYYLHDDRFEPLFPLRKTPERYEKVAELDGLQVYRDKKAMPRAYLLGEAQTVDGFDGLLRAFESPGFDPTRVACVEGPLPVPLPAAEANAALGGAKVVSRTHNRVAVEVEAARRSILVLADAYYPGWRATVDGVDVSIFPVDYVLRGIVVEPGRHRVTYEYFPASFRLGLGLSVAACVGSIAWVLAWFVLRKRRGGGDGATLGA